MSLLDAFLLDPYPYNVWIAKRTDGLKGSGTVSDPYDGSTQLRFDGIMALFQNQSNVRIQALFRDGVTAMRPIRKDNAVFRKRLKLSPKARPGPLKILCDLRYQVCNDELCWPPKIISLADDRADFSDLPGFGSRVLVPSIQSINWRTESTIQACPVASSSSF